MAYSIYILYSAKSDIYYIGFSDNPVRRLEEHNNPQRTKFTSKHLPWVLKCSFEISDEPGEAMRAEKFIKKQMSRIFIGQLIADEEKRKWLIRLVRVPHGRD